MTAGAGLTEGERWARAELERLRAGGFRPAAVAAFLVASDVRAREVRRARPELARRARAWSALGALAYAGLAASCHRGSMCHHAAPAPLLTHRAPGPGTTARPMCHHAAPARPPTHRAPRAAATAGWWAAVCLMLDWHLGMVESADGEPRNLSAADALTLGRAWLVPLVAAGAGPGVLLLAAATDALDGPVARAGVPTRAGRDLEGLVDAAVVAAALRAAARDGTLARPVVAIELARIGAGFGYAVAVYLARADAPPPAVLRAARVTTPLRLGGLVAAAAGRRAAAGVAVGAGSLLSLALLAGRLSRATPR